MGWMIAVPAIIFMAVVAPLWVMFHYLTRWRAAKGLSREDEAMLAELWSTAERMEERVATLERILDAESPDWRSKT